MTEHLPLLIVLAPLLGAVFAALTTWFWPRLSFPFVLTGLAVSCMSAVMLVFELVESDLKKFMKKNGGALRASQVKDFSFKLLEGLDF